MRYLILVILNLPIFLLAVLNIVTQYRLGKISKDRFRIQLSIWLIIALVILTSFPLYNLSQGNELFLSDGFSWFDIAQITVIVYLLYFINRQRQKIEATDKTLRDLHQELSIKLSSDDKKS